MSRENVELVHRLAAAVGQRDVTALLDLSDPAVEWHTSLSVISEGGAYHGHEGVRQYVRDIEDAFETFDVHLEDVFPLGNVAMAVGRVAYVGKASGVEHAEQFGWILRFREGRALHVRAFRDPEAALEAVGLRE